MIRYRLVDRALFILSARRPLSGIIRRRGRPFRQSQRNRVWNLRYALRKKHRRPRFSKIMYRKRKAHHNRLWVRRAWKMANWGRMKSDPTLPF